jgi:hypothetical protein
MNRRCFLREPLVTVRATLALLVFACATPHAVELAREGVPLNIIQRQLGPANLGPN